MVILNRLTDRSFGQVVKAYCILANLVKVLSYCSVHVVRLLTAGLLVGLLPHFAISDELNSKPLVLPQLTWSKNSALPFYQPVGESGAGGYGDQMQALLEAELSQYRHRSVEIPLRRLNHRWRKKVPICFSTMIYKESESPDYILSIPNTYYESHGLIVRRDFMEALAGSGESDGVRLTELLKTNLRMGKVVSRTYGPIIDGILEASEYNYTERGGDGEIEGVLKMLQHRRFDYVIEYEYIFNYFAKKSSLYDELMFVPIVEVRDQVVLGAIGCTQSAWGRKVIADINMALRTLRDRQDYQSVLLKWLASPGYEERYLARYKNLILNSESALPIE